MSIGIDGIGTMLHQGESTHVAYCDGCYKPITSDMGGGKHYIVGTRIECPGCHDRVWARYADWGEYASNEVAR